MKISESKYPSIKFLVEYLQGLGDGSVDPYPGWGLCTLVALKFENKYDDLLKEYFTSWPMGSRVRGYPVPSVQGGLSAGEMYLSAPNLWEGEYGDLRKELCLYLAKAIKADIEE